MISCYGALEQETTIKRWALSDSSNIKFVVLIFEQLETRVRTPMGLDACLSLAVS